MERIPRYEELERCAPYGGEAVLSLPYQVRGGGYACVWRAGDAGEYAIKSFHDVSCRDAAREEYEYLRRLNDTGCAYVPRVYSLGTFVDVGGKHPAIVMEYVRGDTLASVIEGGSRVGPERAAAIAVRVARAIVDIARAGLVHRDLSPNNIILSGVGGSDGEMADISEDLYLIDFGQSVASGDGTITPAQDGPRLATIPFAAPEVFPGSDHYGLRNSGKCDTWSLGALIAYMASGDEYWPPSVSDLRGRRSLTYVDLERVAESKRDPIDLQAHMRRVGRSCDGRELRLADVVRACTI